jgi:hypothetical protein
MKTSLCLLTCIAAALLGCASSEEISSHGGGGGTAGSGGRAGGDLSSNGGGINVPEGGLGQLSDGGEACAEEIQKADLVPVDLVLLVDSSDSMGHAVVGTTTKWQLISQAVRDFAHDPRSAGLGVGLQFFPQPGDGSPCNSEADCGFPSGGPTPAACQPAAFCAGSASSAEALVACGERRADCPGGAQCLPGGRCAASGWDCTNIGEACASGLTDDTCRALGHRCDTTSGEGCGDLSLYEALPVPIASLPVPAEQLLTRTLAERGPSGGTPLGPAVKGALRYLQAYGLAHAGHREVLVIATDGHPSVSCVPSGIPAIAAMLTMARETAPPVTTYAIGLVPDTDAEGRGALEQLATAGDTGTAFLAAPQQDLAQRFLDALTQIRGKALPCDFGIPASKLGPIDYGKVNLSVKGSAGDDVVLYAGTKARCDSEKGGWYYDVDPAGGTPAHVITCPATCDRLKSDGTATVEIRFGCKTAEIR